MAQVLTHPGPVTIDVGRVTFIDSSGIAFILQVYMLGSEDGRPVVPGPDDLARGPARHDRHGRDHPRGPDRDRRVVVRMACTACTG